jgi:hypothetical protein
LILLAALTASPVMGKIYYVSPTGSDTNAGTSPTAAWGSVAKVDSTSFNPGDEILFQYGSTFHDSLDASSTGTAQAPIVYGAYGNPALGNPVFSGADPLDTSHFTLLSGTTYTETLPSAPNWLYENNQFLRESPDALSAMGQNQSYPASLSFTESTPGSFFYNSGNGTLYLNVGSAPSSHNLSIGDRVDAIYSNHQSNLIFENLNTTQTAQDNSGYGVRVENSTNVTLLNSNISMGGKHNVGVIDGVGFNGINLVANGSAPDAGNGGASAYVSYGDANPNVLQGTNGTSTWTNVSYVNPDGPYPAYISHGSDNGIGSIAINNIQSPGENNNGIIIYGTGNNEFTNINGGTLGSNVEVDTPNSLINGVNFQGPNGTISLGSGLTVVQNCVFVGSAPLPGGSGIGVIVSRYNNTIRFNTMNLPNGGGAAIAVITPQSASNIYGNVMMPASGQPAGAIWLQFDGTADVQSNYNLVSNQGSGVFATGTLADASFLTYTQWQALGYDANSSSGAPVYVNAPVGNYYLQAGSPGIGLVPSSAVTPTSSIADALLGPVNSNGKYNAGINPIVSPVLSNLSATLILNSGQVNTLIPAGGTLSISSVGSLTSGASSTFNLVGNLNNSGALQVLGTWIQTGNVSNAGFLSATGPQIWQPLSVFTNTAGSATFSSDLGGTLGSEDNVTLNVSGGTVNLASTQHLLGLNITTGGKVTVTAATGRSVLVTPSLSVTGVLDLTGNDLLVQAGDLPSITTLIKSGYNLGSWNGHGIISSTAANDTSHVTAVGAILNSVDGINPLYGSGAPEGLFDGVDPVFNDVLVKYTYYGDTNLDGIVDATDYSRIDNGYLNHLSGWFNGDFNYDGVVDGSDYTLIDNAYNSQSAQLSASITAEIAAPAAVPEPSTTIFLALLAPLPLLSRRRYRLSK